MTKYGRGPNLFLIKVFLLDECPGIIIERCWPRGIRQKCVYLCTLLIENVNENVNIVTIAIAVPVTFYSMVAVNVGIA